MLCCHWLWPSATCRQPTQPLPACLRAEEAHATSFGPYASTTAAALAEQKAEAAGVGATPTLLSRVQSRTGGSGVGAGDAGQGGKVYIPARLLLCCCSSACLPAPGSNPALHACMRGMDK